MGGNTTPGRERASCARKTHTEMPQDVQLFNRKTALPQKVYCSIEMRTMSPWRPVRCSQECADSWGHLRDGLDNRDLNTETRYDREPRGSNERTSIEYTASYEEGDLDDWDASTRSDVSAERSGRGTCGFKGRVGRNARERRRVRAVSGAFLRLRRAVPQAAPGGCGPSKRLSKLKTLKSAITYIQDLQKALRISNVKSDAKK